jgi:hypothetical protein
VTPDEAAAYFEPDEDPADTARAFAESTRGGVTAPPVDPADLFRRLTLARDRRGIRWAEVAAEADVPITALRRLSNAIRPEPEHAAALEQWLADQAAAKAAEEEWQAGK